MPDSLPRAEFWQRMASFTFAVWAIMIPIGVVMIRSSFNDLGQANAAVASALIDYKLATERRITLLEERQLALLTSSVDHDHRLTALERAALAEHRR